MQPTDVVASCVVLNCIEVLYEYLCISETFRVHFGKSFKTFFRALFYIQLYFFDYLVES